MPDKLDDDSVGCRQDSLANSIATFFVGNRPISSHQQTLLLSTTRSLIITLNHDRFSGCTDSYRTWNGIRQSAFSNLRGQPSTNHPLTHPSLCLNGPCTSSTASTTTLNHLLHEHQLSQVYPSRQSPSSNGTLATLLQIVRLEGISSLWRGIAPSLMISIPAQAIYMLGYDTLRSTLLDLVPLSDRNGSSSAIRDTVALVRRHTFLATRAHTDAATVNAGRQAQVTRIAPFEHNGLRGSGGNSRPIISMILGSVRSTGLRSLYAGLPATLWRDVPFSGIYWSSYEAVRRILSGGLGFGEADHRASVHQLALQSFCAGSLSGALAATLTNPFDVVKTRRQASPLLLPNHSLSRLPRLPPPQHHLTLVDHLELFVLYSRSLAPKESKKAS
ncbi:hypothetical protein PSHT_09112 [Puccinia striiformis]|uniref:Uncharacterized protein n=1 Tax=Puccinia striiformis TaxID=27350 RepID=A0A2S4VIW0_9BASI|nr:hypothetical protein PSHT_09112 [Puccinia striiformis]